MDQLINTFEWFMLRDLHPEEGFKCFGRSTGVRAEGQCIDLPDIAFDVARKNSSFRMEKGDASFLAAGGRKLARRIKCNSKDFVMAKFWFLDDLASDQIPDMRHAIFGSGGKQGACGVHRMAEIVIWRRPGRVQLHHYVDRTCFPVRTCDGDHCALRH